MLAKARECTARGARGTLTAMLAIIAGCSSTAVQPTAPGAVQPPAATTAPAHQGAQTLQVDPARTVVTIVVRRAGPLAKLGHDHVVTSADEVGTVWLGDTPADSAFELSLPVARFDVDQQEARAAAGPEFAASVPDNVREGTRHNMLRAEVLDGEHFPTITLRSSTASGVWPQPVVGVAVTLKGVERAQEVAVVVERSATGVVARGELRLNQSDFGMTPFAVAGGAIQVADTLEVRFEIAAAAPGAITPPSGR